MAFIKISKTNTLEEWKKHLSFYMPENGGLSCWKIAKVVHKGSKEFNNVGTSLRCRQQ